MLCCARTQLSDLGSAWTRKCLRERAVRAVHARSTQSEGIYTCSNGKQPGFLGGRAGFRKVCLMVVEPSSYS